MITPMTATWDFYRICWIGGYGADQEIDAYIRLRSDFTTDQVKDLIVGMGLFLFPTWPTVEAVDGGFIVSVHRPYFSLAKQSDEDLANADYVNDEYAAPKERS